MRGSSDDARGPARGVSQGRARACCASVSRSSRARSFSSRSRSLYSCSRPPISPTSRRSRSRTAFIWRSRDSAWRSTDCRIAESRSPAAFLSTGRVVSTGSVIRLERAGTRFSNARLTWWPGGGGRGARRRRAPAGGARSRLAVFAVRLTLLVERRVVLLGRRQLRPRAALLVGPVRVRRVKNDVLGERALVAVRSLHAALDVELPHDRAPPGPLRHRLRVLLPPHLHLLSVFARRASAALARRILVMPDLIRASAHLSTHARGSALPYQA